jgi:pimeloyl-ACP methyl ester carboxylesterase
MERSEMRARQRIGSADYMQLAGIRLHVKDTGPRDAPALVLLHGFGASLQTWDGWAALLESDFRVIRYDLAGFGYTGPDPTGDYSDRRALQIQLALMDALGLERASLIGNSLGGKLAWKFAAAYASRVDRLVLIAPDGFASPGFRYGQAPRVPFAVRLMPFFLPKTLLRTTLAAAYGDPARLTEATVSRYYDMMCAPGNRNAIVARLGQVMLTDPVPELEKITAPTLLLWGEKDRMIPVANAKDYLRAIPGATLVKLPGLGHVPFEEAPQASIGAVRRFLTEAHPAEAGFEASAREP